jgi:endonuclease/exonuclease/phosphatase family metal-dependent hydrolase
MPLDLTMERVLQCTMSYAPPKEQHETHLLERIQFVATSLLLILTLVFNLFLYGLAAVIDTIAQSFNPSKFEYLEGEGVEKRGDPKVIVTWNVCSLLGGLPIPFGGVAPVEMRIDEIAKKIIESDADVVSLQEVSPPAAHLLYQRLRNEFRHFYTRIDPDPILMLDSGLMVISKIALENPNVLPLPRLGILHRAFFTFKVGNLSIGTTHLEAGQEPESEAMRAKQIEKILESPQDILLGDWNEETCVTTPSSDYQNTYEGEESTATDRFIGRNVDYKIDHLFARRTIQINSVLDEGYQVGNWAISDHHLVKGTLTLA